MLRYLHITSNCRYLQLCCRYS